ncbi:transmembrane and coiled-coil domains protein 2 [Geospiza fortis]|uniref:Transmembrane and coiled-coil domains protein 2 n=1 Tax=Geospiza fortis TaxID=48883 RepID=A0A8N5F2G3_GEOFO|nr:transmembrane and coiled-coil domains protein 2 [Geospiza fortis]
MLQEYPGVSVGKMLRRIWKDMGGMLRRIQEDPEGSGVDALGNIQEDLEGYGGDAPVGSRRIRGCGTGSDGVEMWRCGNGPEAAPAGPAGPEEEEEENKKTNGGHCSAAGGTEPIAEGMKSRTEFPWLWGKKAAPTPGGSAGFNRSSSTTDTAILLAEGGAVYLLAEDSEGLADKLQLDKGDVPPLNLPAGAGGHGDADGPVCLDVPDGTPDPQRTKAAIEHLHQKILKITEQIKIEQEARDDNVAEYLKLANNADKQQASRIKQVFEKKNQKSAQTIAQLHKKLEHYHKKLKEIEQNGPSRQPKDVFRDMHQGLKDVGANVRSSISGFSGGLGSPKSNTLDSHHNNFDTILEELREIKDSQSHLEDSMEDLKAQLQRDYTYMTQCLQEERYRYERLEEQLNDLTELHQNEMTNLKQELASMEEKVAYQSYERARDIQVGLWEGSALLCSLQPGVRDRAGLGRRLGQRDPFSQHLQGRFSLCCCHSKRQVAKPCPQNQGIPGPSASPVVQLEGVENANARALLGKFINVILALMAVLLVFVSTIANFITPLMKTRMRILSTALLVLFLFFLWKHWDSISYLLEHVLLPS